MKRIFSLIILAFCVISVNAQFVEVKQPTWTQTPTAWVLEGILGGLDSVTSGNSTAFDATPIIGRFLLGDSVTAIKGKNSVIAFIRVKGSASSVDTLAYVRISTVTPTGVWIPVDTLPTNKSTGIWDAVSLNGLGLNKEARIEVSSANVTASGNAMKLEYQIIIPKRSY